MAGYPHTLPVYIRVGDVAECHAGDLDYGPEDDPARLMPGFLRGVADIMDAGLTGQDTAFDGIVAGLEDGA